MLFRSGLKDDDKILLEGLRKVHSGQQIEMEFKSPDKVRDELHYYAE